MERTAVEERERDVTSFNLLVGSHGTIKPPPAPAASEVGGTLSWNACGQQAKCCYG